MSDSSQGSNFNIIHLMLLILIIGVGITVLIPALSATRRTARGTASNTQMRGIQQSLIIFAQSNGGGKYYPGLDSQGHSIPDGEATGFSGDGAHPAARYWILLQANSFTPEYAVSAADTHATEAEWGGSGPMTHGNYSYAMMSLRGTDNETAEWQETLNPAAIVVSDRALGTGPSDISSVWTEPGSRRWKGQVARNDNSVSYVKEHQFNNTQYGEGQPNRLDDIFEDAPSADDGYMVHKDAATAYSLK